MRAIREIEKEGYSLSLEGNRIQARKKKGFSPDIGKIKDLLNQIKAHKGQVISYLNRRKISVLCPYKGCDRWICWAVCEWHREENDPECKGCRPENRLKKRKEI